jgi:ribosomal protein L2
MAVRIYRPTSPGTRFKSEVKRTEGSANAPHKPLLDVRKRTGGRDNRGLLAIRHRGGGHKRRYRVIDFRRDKLDVPGKVETLEYDPNRTANIALVCYADGERRYIRAGRLASAKVVARRSGHRQQRAPLGDPARRRSTTSSQRGRAQMVRSAARRAPMARGRMGARPAPVRRDAKGSTRTWRR